MSNEQASDEGRRPPPGFRKHLRAFAFDNSTRRRVLVLLLIVVVAVGLIVTGHKEVVRLALVAVAANINVTDFVNDSNAVVPARLRHA